ncbi:hypothetical protein FRB96_008070 [Tulasnella sp. 330]|nr:hypothetical protein FRB96_008070 [Tulasnella sp. 330]KAG8867666.1 hypothetical protein FRB98_004057 [Tulasnella sp. 332]KAG8876613.1 hypothetical protein FRB97_004054 [Tulasnella sp. 331]
MTRCAVLNITFTPSPSAVPTPQPPYQLIISLTNHTPLVVDAGSSDNFQWPLTLDVGGPYLMTMYDSAGATGGTSQAFNVLADTTSNSTCDEAGLKSSTLNLGVGATHTQCGTVPITVSGGSPPYVVSLVAEDSPPKRASFAAGNIDWIIDLKAGINAYFTVTDTLGNGAVSQFFKIGASSDMSCLTVAQTLTPGSPALSTIYPGTGAASSTGTSGSTVATANYTTDFIYIEMIYNMTSLRMEQ